MLSIEDRLGLQDLIANYSWALDTSDAEGLVACFTEDCVMSEEVFEDPDVWEGHEGIRGLMAHYANAAPCACGTARCSRTSRAGASGLRGSGRSR